MNALSYKIVFRAKNLNILFHNFSFFFPSEFPLYISDNVGVLKLHIPCVRAVHTQLLRYLPEIIVENLHFSLHPNEQVKHKCVKYTCDQYKLKNTQNINIELRQVGYREQVDTTN